MTDFELYAYFVILSEAKNLILSQSNYSINYPKGVDTFGMQNLKDTILFFFSVSVDFSLQKEYN